MKSKVAEKINFKERLKFEISGFSSFKTQSISHEEVDSRQSWSTLFRPSSSSEKEIEHLMSACEPTIFGESNFHQRGKVKTSWFFQTSENSTDEH